jgi:hypothetical protein
MSESAKERCQKTPIKIVTKGKTLVNDGNKCKYVLTDDVNMYLNQGWKLGRLRKDV